MRIIYMGTPDFAVKPLEEIYKAGHEIVLVVTQPDKPNSRRGNKVIYSPVKQKALELGLEVFQPNKVSEEESFEKIKSINSDMIVVCAFGQILKENILSASKYGCYNIHASLLPKYRGAAPLNRVLMDGEEKSGVTVMAMDKGLDTGDMILKKEVLIDGDMNVGTLHDLLSEKGAIAMVEAIDLIKEGKEKRQKQDESKANYANKISKEDCHINFNRCAREIHNLIRGLSPYPTAFALLDGKNVKILESTVTDDTCNNLNAGEILGYDKLNGILVSAKKGIIGIKKIKVEGKRAMDHSSFWAGNKDIIAKRFS